MATKVGKCKRCGSRLTDPVSVERGYGPVCWEKEGQFLVNQISPDELETLKAQLRTQKKEIEALKQMMSNLRNLPPVPSLNNLPPVPNGTHGTKSKIPLQGNAEEYISELKTNPLFQQYAGIADQGMVA